jgi:formamidopyrimidine-DNA glycosylase
VRRSLEPLLVGRTLGRAWLSDKKLRRAPPPSRFSTLPGRTVMCLGRQGKLMWLELDDGGGLMVRLGMTGRLLVQGADEPRAPHTHVVIPLDDGADELRYVDVRRFGEVRPFADPVDLAEERARLGPDPTTWSERERAAAAADLRRTQRPLKDAVLDQTRFAGVGNIYACEALFEAHVSPLRRGTSLRVHEADALTHAIADVLRRAVEHRGTTFSDFVDGEGREGENLAFLQVFQREGEPCPRCGGPVERTVQSGRSTFHCAGCQPRRPIKTPSSSKARRSR